MKKSMLTLALLLALPALAEEAPEEAKPEAAAEKSAEAIEILKKADEAARAVGAVRFHSVTEPTGLVANFVGAAEGSALMHGWDELMQRPASFWAHVETTPPGAEEAKELTGGGDGESYFLIDHGTKKAYEDMDPGVLGTQGQALLSIGIAQFVHPSPYERDLGAEKIVLLPEAEVGGEPCYVIQVDYPAGSGGAEVGSTWSIAKSDHLPRRRVRRFAVPEQGEGDLTITLSKLEIDPEIDPKLFKLSLPEGYEQIDDFAP